MAKNVGCLFSTPWSERSLLVTGAFVCYSAERELSFLSPQMIFPFNLGDTRGACMTSEDVRVIRNGGCLGIVRMYGEYDIASKEQFQGALEPLYDCESVMIDMKDVDYIDSTVLSCLIRLNNEMQKRHGEAHVEVCNASSNIRRIFEMCGLDRLFGVS